ncbi:hypothetical protein [Luteimonas deserti]|uniref:hypothetical protein n=1 Tax=Luteimonas deserti TaxID=2752306 RepID=UPI002E2BE4D4|nr:hypothetical protein [Luteimonas deserti]
MLLTLAVLLVTLAWLQATGSAALSGMSAQEMDWDEDGTLSRSDILRSVFSVVAERRTEGTRSCVEYRWRRSGEVIRLECRTTLADPQ